VISFVPPVLTFKNFTFCPHGVFGFCMALRTTNDKINWLIFRIIRKTAKKGCLLSPLCMSVRPPFCSHGTI